ncbi:MAG: transposase family protein [Candidatus Bathyarchaeota archaeon]|nr:transposase family protein [Candidatus Termiticorpusculum sp.]
MVKRLALGDPKPKLSLQDMLLTCLEYIREYCTHAHVAASYGMSESQIFQNHTLD